YKSGHLLLITQRSSTFFFSCNVYLQNTFRSVFHAYLLNLCVSVWSYLTF
ncbi:hypothetical protein L9F63_021348, partial [Diploptera punctata]